MSPVGRYTTSPGSIDALQAKIEALQSDVGEIKQTTSRMVEALAKLTSLEQQHLDTKDALKRAFGEIASTNGELKALQERLHQRQLAKDDQIRKIELTVPENLPERLRQIEVVMPGLLEMRKYVVSGVVAVVGLVGLALLAIVIITPPRIPPATVVVPAPQVGKDAPMLKRPLWVWS